MHELKKNIERKIYFVVSILIASNAFFVQRVISSVDTTTSEVSQLKEQVARIETKLEFLNPVAPSRWKKL